MLNEPRRIKDLDAEEFDAYTKEGTQIVMALIDELKHLADKHDLDIYETVLLHSKILSRLVPSDYANDL